MPKATTLFHAESITNFVQDSAEWVADHVDRLLDTYTDGKHSGALDHIIKKKRIGQNVDENIKSAPPKPSNEQIEGLRSLKEIGINIDFLPDDEHEFLEKSDKLSALEASAKNLLKLKELQDERMKRRGKLYGKGEYSEIM